MVLALKTVTAVTLIVSVMLLWLLILANTVGIALTLLTVFGASFVLLVVQTLRYNAGKARAMSHYTQNDGRG